MIPPLLIVVHPGSLCGSLDMHRGEEADGIRESIINEIESWSGDVAVINGDLSSELQDDEFIDLRIAVEGNSAYNTKGEATAAGLARAAKRIAKVFNLTPNVPVTVTGAWNDKDGQGCVTAVKNSLVALGLAACVSPNSPHSDCETTCQPSESEAQSLPRRNARQGRWSA